MFLPFNPLKPDDIILPTGLAGAVTSQNGVTLHMSPPTNPTVPTVPMAMAIAI
jgi:hypothetical protein